MEPSLLFVLVFGGFLLYWFLVHPKVKRAGGWGAMLRSGSQGQPKALTADQRLITQADQLLAEVKSSVARSSLSDERKRELVEQASAVPQNVRRGVERLEQLQRLRGMAQSRGSDAGVAAESIALETKVRTDINHSLDLLTQMPLALTRIEVERDTVDLERMVADLGETNARLNDTAEAARELRATS